MALRTATSLKRGMTISVEPAHGSLRAPRRSRRVADDGEIRGFALHCRELRACVMQPVPEHRRAGDGSFAPDHDVGEVSDALQGQQRSGLVRRGERHTGTGVGHRVAHLVRREHAVEGIHDCAGLGDAVVGDEPLPAVGAEQAHTVTGLDAGGHQAVCDSVGQRIELAEREPAILDDQGCPLRVSVGGAGKDLSERCDHGAFFPVDERLRRRWEGGRRCRPPSRSRPGLMGGTQGFASCGFRPAAPSSFFHHSTAVRQEYHRRPGTTRRDIADITVRTSQPFNRLGAQYSLRAGRGYLPRAQGARTVASPLVRRTRRMPIYEGRGVRSGIVSRET